MTNHPNRSASSPIRYVAYSTASLNALAEGTSIEEARERAMQVDGGFGSDEFLIVFETRSRDDLDCFDCGTWRRNCRVVWRGSNELAQRA